MKEYVGARVVLSLEECYHDPWRVKSNRHDHRRQSLLSSSSDSASSRLFSSVSLTLSSSSPSSSFLKVLLQLLLFLMSKFPWLKRRRSSSVCGCVVVVLVVVVLVAVNANCYFSSIPSTCIGVVCALVSSGISAPATAAAAYDELLLFWIKPMESSVPVPVEE